ncbi:MAG: type II toxin-antitoxin system RelB/DinJ family antitoxin [Defluviitaleaceae bacterium]|nr:type II toxin-antitoxin system RelB/DinJ family antitoxin [Defluviitaleaceae bacterium]MCL2274020.1 type II toxin-antitoxin system RelB/DinJ family antitoxin [Defluviitaleaceae bacterium]MCL2274079.1 type II toxin-antitoxin system RelB/DinJ family antitoxin [Defluviitaleaceae bacterium]
MQRTANVFARVEPEIKQQAEQVLNRLGIPMSNAIGHFLRQVVMHRGMPFELKLPPAVPVAMGALSANGLNAELEKGYAAMVAGEFYDIDDVISEMQRDYNI